MTTEAELAGLIARLREACNGHPHAKIAWPHRVLHEAATALAALVVERDGLREALKPFVESDVDGEGTEEYSGEKKAVVQVGRSTCYALTLADFRRARQTLKDTAP